MDEKVTGYTLLAIGLLIIAYAAFSVFQVFTKRSQPVQLFNFPPVSVDIGQLTPGIDMSSLPPQAQELLALQQAAPQAKPAEIISSEMINQTSNVFAHLFLMGFVASIGYKVASLGVMLLRPVEVKVKTKEIPVNQ